MSNFASRPELYGGKYDAIFESSLQSPIPDQDKLQYFRAMFDNDVRSYLTDEDRQEIAQEYYAKGAEAGFEKGVEKGVEKNKFEIARAMLSDGVSLDLIEKYTGLSKVAIAEI